MFVYSSDVFKVADEKLPCKAGGAILDLRDGVHCLEPWKNLNYTCITKFDLVASRECKVFEEPKGGA